MGLDVTIPKKHDKGTFEEAISQASNDMQQISIKLRELIVELYPGVWEVAWAKQKIIGYGIGPKKMSEHFVYIAPFAKHVNLGFYYGASLDDPHNLLDGSGKKLRHIKIKTMDAITNNVKQLITDAIEEIKSRF